jgi:thiopeptide-type bacteriocin biosynthesis protein
MVIASVLVRAPLFAAGEARGARALFREGLARAALELASPALVGAKGEKGDRARENFASRARFRATPHGWWAGVGVARLGARTKLRTGEPRAHATVAWGRLASLGRALLDDPSWRERAKVRTTPSLLAGASRVSWMAMGEHGAEPRSAEVDDELGRVLQSARGWTAWPRLRAEVGGDASSIDEYLLLLVDDGLLEHDLEPPLVGAPPLTWMRERLGGELPALDEAAALLERDPAAAVEEARTRLAALPGHDEAAPSLHGTLTFALERCEIARAPVERAAELAQLLFRVQETLAPPSRERALDPSLGPALDTVTDVLGAGALDLAGLANGEYGITVGAPPQPGTVPASAPLLQFLVEGLVATGAGEELALDPARLDALCPTGEAPPTFELLLTPTARAQGWLLGLHAPAGASWGRFAHALGAPLADALAQLDQAEQTRPERRVDLAWAPSPSLADLCTHPPVRARSVDLRGASERGVPLATLSLVADGAALEPLALRLDDERVEPSPLHRVRSTLAAQGMHQLVAGFSLVRQHAPWALSLGPLAGLPYLPRLTVDGFVVSPRSWRVPSLANRAALGRWRREAGVPRLVQIGQEDELLLVDLDGSDAHRALAGAARAYEVWPPLDDTPDADGRRVELIAQVVSPLDGPARARSEAASRAVAAAGRVPPPRQAPPADGWRTFRLYGAADRADRLLVGVVAPLMTSLRDAIEGWFFLRYVEAGRDHLRLRVRAAKAVLGDVQARLDAALDDAWAAGDLVSVESGPYFRERARYGAEAMDAVERIFEADSELACTLLAEEAEPLEATVRAFDALAGAFELDPAARRELARRRRAAHEGELAPVDESLAQDFRARQSRLHEALTAAHDPALMRYAARVGAAARTLPTEQRAGLLPPLLHLSSVRLQGVDRFAEARAYYLWERALDGIIARKKSASR